MTELNRNFKLSKDEKTVSFKIYKYNKNISLDFMVTKSQFDWIKIDAIREAGKCTRKTGSCLKFTSENFDLDELDSPSFYSPVPVHKCLFIEYRVQDVSSDGGFVSMINKIPDLSLIADLEYSSGKSSNKTIKSLEVSPHENEI